MEDLKMTTYEQNKITKLTDDVISDLRDCKEEMKCNISDDNQKELQEDTSFILNDNIRRLSMLQSQHVFLNKEDTIKANRLMYIVNHIIKDIEI